MSSPIRFAAVFVLSLYLGFLLTTLAMPAPLNWIRPNWIPMIIIFWIIQFPAVFGLLSAVIAGVLFDVLVGAPLGLHAFTFSVVAFLTLLMHRRIKFFNVWQQLGIIFVLTGTERLLAYWLSILVGDATGFTMWPAISNLVLWLPTCAALGAFQRLFNLR